MVYLLLSLALIINFNPIITDDYVIYEIIYSFEMHPVKDLDENPHHLNEYFKLAQIKIKEKEAILLFSKTQSIFKTPDVTIDDTADIFVFGTVQPGQTYYYNANQDILILRQIELGVESRMNYIQELEWEITNETAIINGILCKKAYATQRVEGFNDGKFTAWFAPDIPFPFGPRMLNGLPGVILKYRYGGLVVRAKSIKRIDDRKEKIDFPDFKGAPSFSETVR